jgi:hypothetical protein
VAPYVILTQTRPVGEAKAPWLTIRRQRPGSPRSALHTQTGETYLYGWEGQRPAVWRRQGDGTALVADLRAGPHEQEVVLGAGARMLMRWSLAP